MDAEQLIRSAKRLKQREDDRCAWPSCRDTGDAACYRSGATELNRGMDVELCDFHLRSFCLALDALREQEQTPRIVRRKPNPSLFE